MTSTKGKQNKIRMYYKKQKENTDTKSLSLLHLCLSQDQVNWCPVMCPAPDGSGSAHTTDSRPN